MEMTFPHKSLAKTSADTDVSATSAYDMLIAHATARQSLSPSARAYLAGQGGCAVSSPRTSRGLMEDRIQFFAGEPSRQGPLKKNERVFKKGHFRPDLLRKNPSGGAVSE